MPERLHPEQQRLQALRDLLVLDSQPEPLFDQLAQMASQVCGVPVALVSLVDDERQWFKANIGLGGVQETPRDVAFCAHAIAGSELFEVPDASTDARFAGNPLVTGAPDIRFYAGAPLVMPGGERVGTLCVIDRQPRQLSPEQKAQLQQLASLVMHALVMRRDLTTRALAVRSEYETLIAQSEARYRAIVEDQQELVSLSRPDGTLVFVNQAYAAHFGLQPHQMVGASIYDYIAAIDQERVRDNMARVLGTGEPASSENRMLGGSGAERWVAWSNRLQINEQRQPLLHSVGRDVTKRRHAEEALRASQAFLTRTGRLAGVGGWEVDLHTQTVHWSEQTKRIHGVAADFVPTLDSAIAFYAPEAQAVVQAAVQRGIESKQPWDLELPFVNAQGQALWVRAVGEVEVEDGQPRRLVGAFQDVTERRKLQQRLTDSEEFTRKVADGLPLRLAYIDHELRFQFANQTCAQRLGLMPADMLGHTRAELAPDAVTALLDPHFRAALAGQPGLFEYDDRVDGQVRRMEVRLTPDRDEQGRVRGFFGVDIDVTEHQLAKVQLQQQTATLRAVIDALPATVAVVQADGRLRLVNRAFQRWLGQAGKSLLGRAMLDVIGSDSGSLWLPWIQRVQRGETVSFDVQKGRQKQDKQRKQDTGLHGNQQHLWVSLIPLHDDADRIDGYLCVAQDVTPHKRENVRLLQLAQRDPLTGLLNRRGASEAFMRLFASADAQPLALLCIDLDHFKPVNDAHGHATGDQVLHIFAQRLSGLVRPGDVVARLGGDEFVLLLIGVREAAHASAVAGKVIQAASSPMHVGDLVLQVGASVGLAWGAAASLSEEAAWADLLSRADAKLYEAKAAGRGRQAI